MRLISLSIVIILSMFTNAHGKIEKKYTRKYDSYFRKYSKHNFGVGFDWRWFKAQAIAESNLNENVKSWNNAKGLMQLLPSTFNELCKKHPELRKNIYHPRWNIAAGILYDKKLWKKWQAERPFLDRLSFTFASYNAGFRTILRAQEKSKKKGLNENYWASIEMIASEVRKWRYKETLIYVLKIKKIFHEFTY